MYIHTRIMTVNSENILWTDDCKQRRAGPPRSASTPSASSSRPASGCRCRTRTWIFERPHGRFTILRLQNPNLDFREALRGCNEGVSGRLKAFKGIEGLFWNFS